jgi:hypothetical protein
VASAAFLVILVTLGWKGGQEPKKVPREAIGDILRVTDVRPGMKGYGLSVFSGTKIEKFDVEVVSVLKKYYGDKDILLVRIGHPVTDHANIIRGMSGSPIYLEGRLAGALSLGFVNFAKDPLAGITPIEYMLADKDHPWEEEAFLRPIPQDEPVQHVRTPLFVSGLPPAAFKELKEFSEPLGFSVVGGSAGQADLPQEIKLEPGAAVGISILRGDINMDGVGTVTYVSGNDVLVFGHSMLMGGQIELPMTTAYVHTVMASQDFSYKLASPIKPVGCFLKDRLTSVYGTLEKQASTIPFTVEIENAQTRFQKTFRFELSRHPLYTPYLITQVPGFCLDLAEAGNMKDQTIHYALKLKFEGMAPLEIKDAYISSPMGFQPRGFMETVFKLLGNPFRRVRLEGVEVRLSVVHQRSSATIDAVWLQSRKVKPGESLTLTLRLRPYNKESFKETIEIPLPRTLPDGEYEIAVMGGRDAAGAPDMQGLMRALLAGRMPGMTEAQSFEELLQEIRRRHPSNRILARIELPALGVRAKDHRLENLPGSVFVNLVSTPSAGMKLERDLLDVTRDTNWVIEGRKSVKFEMRTPGQVEPEK